MPPGMNKHDESERSAVKHEPKIAKPAQELGQHREQDGAADRADQRSHTADDHHGEDR